MNASYFKRVAVISKSTKIAEVSNMIQKDSESKLVKVKPIINHVICIDISGSMWDVLPKIRTQLKSRLVDIVGDNDTVSIIWFNDKCGFVSEMVHITKANDLREMNKKIDQALKPGGCTNFLDPMKLTNSLIDRMNSVKGLWSFFFMSDGGHNTGGSWDMVIKELSNLQEKISNAVICEYGYWADSDRLTQMAEVLGGQKIFDKDFDDYQSDFENVIKTGSTETVKRVEFDITDFKPSMKLQLMYTIDKVNKSIKVYSTDRVNKILIPEDTDKIYYIQKNSPSDDDCNIADSLKMDNSQIYAAVYILAERLKYNLAEEILYSTRDKEMIDMFSNSFGKQKLEEFKSSILNRVYGVTECESFTDSKYRPNPKKYCVMDFIEDLISDESNLVHLTHPDFKYNRTTAKSVAKIELSDEDRNKLSKSPTKSKASKILDEASKYQVKMKVSDELLGYSVKNLTWNNERANISFMVDIPVDLTVPTMDHSGTFDVKSKITRNYTLVKDGILNMNELILTVTPSLRGKFKRMGLVTHMYNDNTFKVDISSLPILNKKRTDSIYSLDLKKLELGSLDYKIINKYVAYLIKKSNQDSIQSDKSISKNKYLESLGITSNGYSPKTEISKSGDFYMATCLSTKIEKFSSIPKIEDVLSKKKLTTISDIYTKNLIDYVDSILAKSSDKQSKLKELYDLYKSKQKDALIDISKMKFILIVSRKWFADKSGFDDNSLTVDINGNQLKMSFVFTEKKVDL